MSRACAAISSSGVLPWTFITFPDPSTALMVDFLVLMLCAIISFRDGPAELKPAAITSTGLCHLERRRLMTLLAADMAEEVAKECIVHLCKVPGNPNAPYTFVTAVSIIQYDKITSTESASTSERRIKDSAILAVDLADLAARPSSDKIGSNKQTGH